MICRVLIIMFLINIGLVRVPVERPDSAYVISTSLEEFSDKHDFQKHNLQLPLSIPLKKQLS